MSKPQHKRQSAKPPKVFDVLRPGKAPAHATSRPVVGNRQTVRDLDFNERPLMDAKQKVALTPSRQTQVEGIGKMSLVPAVETKSVEVSAAKNNGSHDPKKAAATVSEYAEPLAPDEQGSITETEKSEAGLTPKAAAAEMPPTNERREDLQTPYATNDNEVTANTAASQQETTQEEQASWQAPATTVGAGNPSPQDAKPSQGPRKAQTPYTGEGVSDPLHMGMPADLSGKIVVSHHKKHKSAVLVSLALIGIALLLAAILNVLLDAEIIQTDLNLPHTNYLDGQ